MTNSIPTNKRGRSGRRMTLLLSGTSSSGSGSEFDEAVEEIEEEEQHMDVGQLVEGELRSIAHAK